MSLYLESNGYPCVEPKVVSVSFQIRHVLFRQIRQALLQIYCTRCGWRETLIPSGTHCSTCSIEFSNVCPHTLNVYGYLPSNISEKNEYTINLKKAVSIALTLLFLVTLLSSLAMPWLCATCRVCTDVKCDDVYYLFGEINSNGIGSKCVMPSPVIGYPTTGFACTTTCLIFIILIVHGFKSCWYICHHLHVISPL